MKEKKSELLPNKIDSSFNNGKINKVELVSCPVLMESCKIHLQEFNKSFSDSNNYRIDKDFLRSVDSLKEAFHRTKTLVSHPCSNCAKFYQSTIIESLENIQDELNMMTTGFLGKKHYKVSLLKVNNTLKDLQLQE